MSETAHREKVIDSNRRGSRFSFASKLEGEATGRAEYGPSKRKAC